MPFNWFRRDKGAVKEPANVKLDNSTPTSVGKVDFSEAPQMEKFAGKVARLCDNEFPKIQQKLNTSIFNSSLLLVFKKDQPAPGLTSGSVISLSSNWFNQHPEDLGAIVHEMAHVVQGYPPGQPSWLTEGIADYIRYSLGYKTSWSYPHCGQGSPHYTSGYWCSAAFLQFIERVYDKDIINKLNTALKNNRYHDSLFQEYTGKSLPELWEESKDVECAGGSP